MRYNIIVLFILLSASSFSQISVTAIVKDSQTGEVLPFCNVSVGGTGKGTITNADGLFSIKSIEDNSVLDFSYLGYERKTMRVSDVQKSKFVFLKRNTYELPEVEIHADNDYLYEILSKSRNIIKRNYKLNVSKAYYCVETKVRPLEVIYPNHYYDSVNNVRLLSRIYDEEEMSEKTAELLECLYNASITGSKIDNFSFRNGRSFIAPPEENYFITVSSSKAFGQFCFFEKNAYFPSTPFQYNKRALKGIFNLELLSFDGKNYHIKFYPHGNDGNCFSGEIWIEKETSQVLNIQLNIENSKIFPLAPIFEGLDIIRNFNMNLTYSFNPENSYLPNHTFFDYNFTYVSRRDTIVIEDIYKKTISKISSNGLIYYYDYNKPFVLPYFEYDSDLNDYYLISLNPYNEILWNSNDIVQLTQLQKQKIGIKLDSVNINNENELNVKEGKLLVKNYFPSQERGLYLFNYLFWSADKRLIISKHSIMDEMPKSVQQSVYPTQLYTIKVQILLDVTETGDSIVCNSWTVFDTKESFYNYEETEETRAFMNIYFDICEIERRKMQKLFDDNKYTLQEIDAVYNSTKSKIERITKRFVIEADRGRNEKSLKKWNDYVLENLGIDNLELVDNTEKIKNK
jgi:hypothetical protein